MYTIASYSISATVSARWHHKPLFVSVRELKRQPTADSLPATASPGCVWYWQCPITVSPSLVQTCTNWLIVCLSVVHSVFISNHVRVHMCCMISSLVLIFPLSHISPNRLSNVAQPSNLLSPYRPSLSPNRLSPKKKFAQTSFAQLVFRPTVSWF